MHTRLFNPLTHYCFFFLPSLYQSQFMGGVGTPGVLVVKKRLLQNAVPAAPGGGTVFFVTEGSHRYLQVIYNM
jgi:selenocysteine lyase/cysteine desulfurase